MVRLLDENIVSYEDFDCGKTLQRQPPTKVKFIYKERTNNSISYENFVYIRGNVRHNYFYDEERACTLFQTHTDTEVTLTLNYTPD